LWAVSLTGERKESKPARPPDPTLKLKRLYQKKDETHETLSFVSRVTGLGYDQETERMTLTTSFDEIYSEMQWTNKKGTHPEGIKTWYLTDGIYKSRLYRSKTEEPEWKLFAVVDGKGEPLTEAQVFHIFEENVEEGL